MTSIIKIHTLKHMVFRCKKRQVTIILLGFKGSGKTSLLFSLLKKPGFKTIPTIGFSQNKFLWKNKMIIIIYDVGGSKTIRGLWKTYYPEVYGVVYIIDSSQIDEIRESKEVLNELMQDVNLKGKPFLILANKQDLTNSINILDINHYLDLENLTCKYLTFINMETSCCNMAPPNKPFPHTKPHKTTAAILSRISEEDNSQNSNSLEGCVIKATTVHFTNDVKPISSFPQTELSPKMVARHSLNCHSDSKITSYPEQLNPFNDDDTTSHGRIELFSKCGPKDDNRTDFNNIANSSPFLEVSRRGSSSNKLWGSNKIRPTNVDDQVIPTQATSIMKSLEIGDASWNDMYLKTARTTALEMASYNESMYRGLDWLFGTILVHYEELHQRVKKETTAIS